MAQELVQEERQEEHGGSESPPPQIGFVVQASGSPSTSIDDIDAQLQYLLNRTVRHNPRNDVLNAIRNNRCSNRITVPESDSIQGNGFQSTRGMAFDVLKMKYHELKSRILGDGKHWWTFADVAPTWEANISKVFAGQMDIRENESITHTLNHNSNTCIMGESFGGGNWANCNDCGWLGGAGSGLGLFTNGYGVIDANKKDGYEEYKMRYEYHWNKYHYDIGATLSKAPSDIHSVRYY